MSEKVLKLKDFIRINPDKTVVELDDSAKSRILDNATATGSRGLLITFDLSHSGRKINNRIYTPSGQRDGANTWLEPFPKPILINHDSNTDPIGRFVSVEWQSLEAEAIDYIGNIQDYVQLKRAYDSADPKRIYREMKRLNLIDDKKWPGLGKLVAKARITDKEAIQKFLDGRYLTFSAGTRTNAYWCMVDGNAWHDGDICEHRPGIVDEDGNKGLFMTGLFGGEEGSVVNMPADDMGMVTGLEFLDFDAKIQDEADHNAWSRVDKDDYIITDSVLQVSVSDSPSKKVPLDDIKDLETKTIAKQVFDGKLDLLNILTEDALRGESHLEIQWLVRVHDALHMEYDMRLAYAKESDEDDMRMPMDVYKLHGRIHEISQDKDFRGSLINGELDQFDSKGSPSTEYLIKTPEGRDALATEVSLLKEAIMKISEDLKAEDKKDVVDESESKEEENESVVQDSTDASDDKQEDKEEKQQDKEEKEEDKKEEQVLEDDTDDEPDWFTLDLALQGMVGKDAELSSEEREELPDDVFCGPDRSFPVNDCAHYTAALRLLGRYKGPGSKDKIRACIERRGKSLGCGEETSEDSSKGCKCKDFKNIHENYVQALQTVDSLKARLVTVLNTFAKDSKADIELKDDDNALDSLNTWFDTITESKDEKNKTMAPEDVQPVENPGVGSSQDKVNTKKLDDFHKRFVANYVKLKDEKGQEKADEYFRASRKYLAPTFDLTQHIN